MTRLHPVPGRSGEDGYAAVWEFVVPPAHQAEFLRHYAPGGSWTQLFRQADGYLGTELLQDRSDPQRYLTLDRWTGIEAYRAFRERFGAEYQALDRACEGLAEREIPLGEYAVSRAAAPH